MNLVEPCGVGARCVAEIRLKRPARRNKARDNAPRAGFPALGWLLRRRGRLLRRRACHDTDATWRAGRSGRCEVPPNVGGLAYGGAVEKIAATVLAPGGEPPGDPTLSPGGTHPPGPPLGEASPPE